MRAVMFSKPGLENLSLVEIPRPEPSPHQVVIKVFVAGVNPIDYFVASGMRKASPIPHIPGAEFAGLVEEVGEHVKDVKPGDKVVVYPWVFDGVCGNCLDGREMVCRSGGLIGLTTNGGFVDYALVDSRNVFKVPEDLPWDLAVSLPVGALTAYHALRISNLRVGDLVVVVGASGNTGMFAVQLAKLMGARVVAVSRKKREWLKEFGADVVVQPDQLEDSVRDLTGGEMADVVIDPLGSQTFPKSFNILGVGGRIVTYGVLTGEDARLPISTLYRGHRSLIGSTGGSRKELLDLIELASRGGLRVKVWRRYTLETTAEALKALFREDRDGRILLQVTS